MPRKKTIVWKEQAYDVGNDVTVTIHYPADRRPQMRHEDTVVIVGPHECVMPPDRFIEAQESRPVHEFSRGGNFGFDENDPAYQAKKAALAAPRLGEPSPPGFSPKVFTSEENFGMKPGETLDLGALAMAAAAKDGLG